MNNYRNIKRLYEQDLMPSGDIQMMPQPTAPLAPAQAVQPEPTAQIEMPQVSTEISNVDPLNMQVSEFIAKCKEIDPLICLGIETFIEKNKEAFNTVQMPSQDEPIDNINFSNTVANVPANSQEATLDFPG
jgi:hypothetical protein